MNYLILYNFIFDFQKNNTIFYYPLYSFPEYYMKEYHKIKRFIIYLITLIIIEMNYVLIMEYLLIIQAQTKLLVNVMKNIQTNLEKINLNI